MSLIAVAALAIVITVAAYLGVGQTVASRLAALAFPKASPSACPSNQLNVSGAIQDCITKFETLTCPSGSFDQARVARLQGNTELFILYVEVNGGYRGPGTYTLAPWPHETLGVPDGVAKVALRKWVAGEFWYSTSGTLTVAKGEESGTVSALLTPSRFVQRDQIRLAGRWMCP